MFIHLRYIKKLNLKSIETIYNFEKYTCYCGAIQCSVLTLSSFFLAYIFSYQTISHYITCLLTSVPVAALLIRHYLWNKATHFNISATNSMVIDPLFLSQHQPFKVLFKVIHRKVCRNHTSVCWSRRWTISHLKDCILKYSTQQILSYPTKQSHCRLIWVWFVNKLSSKNLPDNYVV